MKIRFDHIYCADQKYTFRRKLGRAGFLLDKRTVEHPGKHFCRFLSFPQTSPAGFQYLEFVHVKEGGQPVKIPGLSLGALSSLKVANERFKKKNLKTFFAHKNYNWKENNIDVLPGWNFVGFERKSEIYTWLTEYEPSKTRKRPKKVAHPNGVHKIVALSFVLTKADLKFFTTILGKPKGQVFELACGSQVHYKIGKSSSVDQVIVATKDLNRFVKKYSWDSLISWNNQPGALLQGSNAKMWDLVVVQG